MRFMAGYPVQTGENFIPFILKHKNRIQEVYFSWPGITSGRGSAGYGNPLMENEMQNTLLTGLSRLRSEGVASCLLLNGHCYGRESLARVFFEKIGNLIDFLKTETVLSSITTSSPVIAKFLKRNFPDLECRASVNMEIGSAEGMDYLAEWFDGYYMRRELNRDLEKIRELRSWCLRNGKKLYALANSGCLNFCSAHNFHDNLTAHENEIRAMDNAYDFPRICRQWLMRPEKRERFLSVCNFIRPEDIRLYEKYFDGIKLATRVSRNPLGVLSAYLKGKYTGSLPDLLEPCHMECFLPEILENSLLPADFGERVLRCGHRCEACTYCRDALRHALVNADNWHQAQETGR